MFASAGVTGLDQSLPGSEEARRKAGMRYAATVYASLTYACLSVL